MARTFTIGTGSSLLVLALLAFGNPAAAQIPQRSMDIQGAGQSTAPSHVEEVQELFEKKPLVMDPAARPTTFDAKRFGPDPTYPENYNPKEQLEIYGGKTAVPSPRPLVEWGYPQYSTGPVPEGLTIFGDKNLSRPQLMIFGDVRSAVAFNDGGKKTNAQVAVRANIDVDFALTSTERIHAFFRPLDRGGQFTRYEFAGPNKNNGKFLLNGNIQTLFFEGDIGSILGGIRNEYSSFDMPVAFGKMPLFLQNGIWANSALIGGAVTIPSKNSPMFDITNMDITFFGGRDDVSSPALVQRGTNQLDLHAGRIAGVTGWMDMGRGYLEWGYGRVEDGRQNGPGFGYNNFTLAWSKRYFGMVSNSTRIIVNTGQSPGTANGRQTADGYLILVENSWISPLEQVLVPYANFFFGSDRPQALIRDAGAGGPLNNTGINFETDGLTGFPKLDDTGNNTFGGAIGVNYIFNLEQRIVVELATVQTLKSRADRVAKGPQYAFGVRYQRPLTKSLIVRLDGMIAKRISDDDVAGIRAELRWKF